MWLWVYQLHQTGCESCRRERLPRNAGVMVEPYPGIDFTGTCLLWNLQPVAKVQLGVGGEGRNRTDECSFCRAVPYHLATPPEGPFKIIERHLHASFYFTANKAFQGDFAAAPQLPAENRPSRQARLGQAAGILAGLRDSGRAALVQPNNWVRTGEAGP